MTQSKQDIFNKWKPIMDSMDISEDRKEWLSQYTNQHQQHESNLTGFPTSKSTTTASTIQDFGSQLLPISMKIAAQTIGQNLVSVVPMGGGNTGEEMRKIDAEIKQENRDGKIDSIIENKEYVEKEREDHPDYKKGEGPIGQLFYMDYVYGGVATQSGRPGSII